ncbi:MAG TPA: GDSL-type esterase/lipase family protein [Nitrospiria bacterium]
MTQRIRIVAFGDSLTEGYQSPSDANPLGQSTPYGRFLQDRLGGSVEVLVRGVCGERTEDMARRVEADILALNPDDVVILGGTNDLGWGVPPEKIMRNLTGLYERTQAAGIRSTAVTVPSIRGFDDMIAPRIVLNRLIQDRCAERKMACVDLFSATADPDSQRLSLRYASDGLHLNTAGYRLLADLVYEQVSR